MATRLHYWFTSTTLFIECWNFTLPPPSLKKRFFVYCFAFFDVTEVDDVILNEKILFYYLF